MSRVRTKVSLEAVQPRFERNLLWRLALYFTRKSNREQTSEMETAVHNDMAVAIRNFRTWTGENAAE